MNGLVLITICPKYDHPGLKFLKKGLTDLNMDVFGAILLNQ